MVKLLSDRIQDFMDWLEDETDFCSWDEKIKIEVHKRLIYEMTQESYGPKEIRTNTTSKE